jgi:hypothetical protein
MLNVFVAWDSLFFSCATFHPIFSEVPGAVAVVTRSGVTQRRVITSLKAIPVFKYSSFQETANYFSCRQSETLQTLVKFKKKETEMQRTLKLLNRK